MNPFPWAALRRAAFILYIPTLFVATHWPALKIPGPGYRPDLVVHVLAFGLWTSLFIAAGFFGPPLSWRNIRIAFLIAPLYAALDEALQAIPFIRRTAALDDWLANLAGIVLACTAALILTALFGRRPTTAEPSSR